VEVEELVWKELATKELKEFRAMAAEREDCCSEVSGEGDNDDDDNNIAAGSWDGVTVAEAECRR
jgi:hypothetical protein